MPGRLVNDGNQDPNKSRPGRGEPLTQQNGSGGLNLPLELRSILSQVDSQDGPFFQDPSVQLGNPGTQYRIPHNYQQVAEAVAPLLRQNPGLVSELQRATAAVAHAVYLPQGAHAILLGGHQLQAPPAASPPSSNPANPQTMYTGTGVSNEGTDSRQKRPYLGEEGLAYSNSGLPSPNGSPVAGYLPLTTQNYSSPPHPATYPVPPTSRPHHSFSQNTFVPHQHAKARESPKVASAQTPKKRQRTPQVGPPKTVCQSVASPRSPTKVKMLKQQSPSLAKRSWTPDKSLAHKMPKPPLEAPRPTLKKPPAQRNAGRHPLKPPPRPLHTEHFPRITKEQIEEAIPENASCVFHVFDRRINFDSHERDASLYSLLRSWVQDDPYRQTPPAGSSLLEYPAESILTPLVPAQEKPTHDHTDNKSTDNKPCNILSQLNQHTGNPKDLLKSMIDRGQERKRRKVQECTSSTRTCLERLEQRGALIPPPQKEK